MFSSPSTYSVEATNKRMGDLECAVTMEWFCCEPRFLLRLSMVDMTIWDRAARQWKHNPGHYNSLFSVCMWVTKVLVLVSKGKFPPKNWQKASGSTEGAPIAVAMPRATEPDHCGTHKV